MKANMKSLALKCSKSIPYGCRLLDRSLIFVMKLKKYIYITMQYFKSPYMKYSVMLTFLLDKEYVVEDVSKLYFGNLKVHREDLSKQISNNHVYAEMQHLGSRKRD